MKLILASASPRRRELLKKIGVPFRVMPSRASEDSREKNPRKLVQQLALKKAHEVARRLKSGMVLGSDTVVVLGNQILGKPKDTQHAYQMLYRLSGTTHRVLTGVAIVEARGGKSVVDYAVSKVKMKKMDLDALMRLSRKHLDKAGSYAIQEKHDPIARVVAGSYDNVVGLPVALVKRLLKQISKPRKKPSRVV